MTAMLRRSLAIVAVVIVPGFATAAPLPAEKPTDIDLVLCVDTSNSMDGLIDSAKLRLWDVVNELEKVKPTPRLRVALYSYGNTSHAADAGWVKKVLDLTTDLDEIYAQLNALKTNGGEEYVGRVTRDALKDQDWSKAANALRIIFVCGNESAEQDKKVSLTDVAADARKAGIIINSIYCGPADDSLAGGYRTFAISSNGSFACIDQDKASRERAIATPFDKGLLELNGKLNKTYLAYGEAGEKKAEQQKAQDRAAEANTAPGAAPTAALARSVTKANALYRNEMWDLGDAVKNRKDFDITKLKDEELPEELRKLKPADRLGYVNKKLEERTNIQKEINDIAAQRAKFIAAAKKNEPKSDQETALDEALRSMIRKQAAAVGFEVPKDEKK